MNPPKGGKFEIMNNDIKRPEHNAPEELTNKIEARQAYQKQNNIEPVCTGCSCKHSRVVQNMLEYNDLRIPQNFKKDGRTDPFVAKFVEVLFKSKRKKVYRNDLAIPLSMQDFVIVELENGLDIGTVYSLGEETKDKMRTIYANQTPENSIVRRATPADITRNDENVADSFVVINRVRELVKQYNIDMKVTDAEWQFDHQRLTISFTALQRVDFRELVKELARTFRTRIELRQISTREEAKRIGGVGPCGRYLCCTSFACDFCHVTLDHARIQQLSNNVSKLSGYCGRLKCCLLYEYENYVEAFKHYPPLHSLVSLPEGTARITKIDIFKENVSMHIQEKNLYLVFTREQVDAMVKEGKVQRPRRSDSNDIDPETMKELIELAKEY